MQQAQFIFIGQSGSGKGTQVKLLEQKIKDLNFESRIFHLETGERFRELITSDSFTAHKVKEYIEHGRLPPAFLGVHMWSHVLMEKYNGEDFVFMDGTPRSEREVSPLISAFEFYQWKPFVIFIDVTDDWAKERSLARGRHDDEEKEIVGRLQWFHRDVLPAIDLLKKGDNVRFIQIDGEQSIDKVHQDILAALNL